MAKVRSGEGLQRLLANLGETSDAVAATLTAAGVRGVREEPESCPVANWLRRETGAAHVSVDQDDVCVQTSTSAPRCWDFRTDSPRAVTEFVFAFDDRRYPELETND